MHDDTPTALRVESSDPISFRLSSFIFNLSWYEERDFEIKCAHEYAYELNSRSRGIIDQMIKLLVSVLISTTF